MIRVSVIIPTFNRAAAVCEAIESVLQQTRRADEVIVVDDGSTDKTVARLGKYHDNIIVIQQANQGVSAARNAGVAAASGDWIAFLDSDDVWYPHRLSVLYRDIESSEAGVHVANLVTVGRASKEFRLADLDIPSDSAAMISDGLELGAAPGPSLQATAVRRDWFTAIGGFDPTLTFGEDKHLLCRLALLGPWLVTSDIVACVRRIEGDSVFLSTEVDSRPLHRARMWAKLHDDFSKSGQARRDQLDAVARRLSGTLFLLAQAQFGNGETVRSWWTLLESARRHPSFKGWAKVVPPIMLGRRGYEAVLRQNRGATQP